MSTMFGLAVILLGLVVGANGACDDLCTTTYTTAKDAATTDSAKCTALTAYVVCLSTNLNAATCVWDTTIATAVKTDFTALAGACTIDDTCTCLRSFYETDPTTDTIKCTAGKTLINCLSGKTTAACGNAASTVTKLAGDTETYIKAITGCSLTSTCQCQTNYAKTDLSTANNCTSVTTYKTCLEAISSTTELGCDGTTQKSALLTTINTLYTQTCGASGLQLASVLLLLPALLFRL